MKCQDVLRISFQFLLIVALLVLTYFRFYKLYQEEVSLSNSYENSGQGIHFPSMTLCYRGYHDFSKAPKMNESVTFKEFMESSLSVKDLLVEAVFFVYGPNERNRRKFDFLDINSGHLFEESFYLVANRQYFGLNRCLTLNSPISEGVIFKDGYVSIFLT